MKRLLLLLPLLLLLAACSITRQNADTPCQNDAVFLGDASIPAGMAVQTGQPFIKTWRVQNTGTCTWDTRYSLLKLSGDSITVGGGGLTISATAPNTEGTISVSLMLAPNTPSDTVANAVFQLQAPDGTAFGETLTLRVSASTDAPAATSTTSPPPTTSSSGTAGGACTNNAEFVADVTIPDGSPVQTGVPFVKTWRLRNTGTCTWGGTYTFLQQSGQAISANPATLSVPTVPPSQTIDLSMTLTLSIGTPLGQRETATFQLRAPDGFYFGPTPFVEVIASNSTTNAPSNPSNCENALRFVSDVTIPDGTQVTPGLPFVKTWRVRNTGTCTWGVGYTFGRLTGSYISANPERVSVAVVPPGQETDISITLTLSAETPLGTAVEAKFQMRDPDGVLFGQTPFVKVVAGQGSGVGTLTGCENNLRFVRDVSIPDGTVITRGSTFSKTWRVRNTGTCTWDSSYLFGRQTGDYISGNPEAVSAPGVAPGQEADLTMTLLLSSQAPSGSTQRASFQMRAPNGALFGQTPFVEIKVQ